MNAPSRNSPLVEKRDPSVQGGARQKCLAEITRSLEEDLGRVKRLVVERVFLEESLGDLFQSTVAPGLREPLVGPTWLSELAASSSVGDSSIPREMAKHLTSRGGKLFRATVVLSIVRALSGDDARGPKLAAAMELIHLATLVHDDVIDRADVRRGMASLPSLHDNAPTVLMGDHLFARAFELIAECGLMDIVSSSCRATSAMCRGEIEQLQWIGKADVTEEAYFRLIGMKTAALMASCSESAAILGEAGESVADWHGFGNRLGLVFQLTDDLLDFVADEKVLGKKMGSDVAEGKYTLPLILYRESLGGPEALSRFLSDHDSIQEIVGALRDSGALEATRNRIDDLAQTCHDDLARLAEGGDREDEFERLHDLVDFVVARRY